MEFKDVLEARHSYRIIKNAQIDEKTVEYLACAAQLAPSCFNNQPWKYVFVCSSAKIDAMKKTLSAGNEWAFNGSLIVAVFSEREEDCLAANREYYLFDTGISAGFLMLAATDLGLVAHPIAGYSESKVKKVLNIPDKYKVITLIIIGKHDTTTVAKLSKQEQKKELVRPKRKHFNEFIYFNEYNPDDK